MGNSSSDGPSPVVALLLFAGIAVVVLAAVYSLSAINFGSQSDGTTPVISASNGSLQIDAEGSGNTVVRLTHQEGDTLSVENLTVAVSAQAACGKSGRLVNLPAPGGDPAPESEYVRGDDIFDNSENAVTGPIGEDNVTVNGTWSAGETVTFRIDSEACSIRSNNGIIVRVLHTPTDAVLFQHRLDATTA